MALLLMDKPEVAAEEQDLASEIEQMRRKMVKLGCSLGLMHPEVVRCSEQLDRLLLRYYGK